MIGFIIVVVFYFVGRLIAQVDPIPDAPFTNLPDIVSVILGVVSSFIVEFVQKQKSVAASFLLSVGLSGVAGFIGALVVGAAGLDFATFVVQVFVFGQASFAIIFKGLGLSKTLKTSL